MELSRVCPSYREVFIYGSFHSTTFTLRLSTKIDPLGLTIIIIFSQYVWSYLFLRPSPYIMELLISTSVSVSWSYLFLRPSPHQDHGAIYVYVRLRITIMDFFLHTSNYHVDSNFATSSAIVGVAAGFLSRERTHSSYRGTLRTARLICIYRCSSSPE